MLERSPEILAETFRTALLAPDLRTTDAMYQVFDEVRTAWDVDFSIMEDAEDAGLTLYRNEAGSQDFHLYWSQHYNQWTLMDIDADCNDCTVLEEIVKHLCTLVYP